MALGLLLGLLLLAPARPAVAQAAASCDQVLEYVDPDEDGEPEAMVLACHFAPGTDDRLTVYQDSGELRAELPWRENIDYENETWVFDHEAKGRASLIIHFRKEGASLVATLYDDRDGDGKVAYRLNKGTVVVAESQYWTVRVVAPDGWWLRAGLLNYNLGILIDGDVEGMFMVEYYRSQLLTDGQPDYDIQIYDQNHNGRPEYDKRMILVPFLRQSVGLGTQMMANWADEELPIGGGFDLWPYLDLAYTYPGAGTRVVKGYDSTPAPLKFEPATGRIEAVGEFVASRGGEQNCFYYSAKRWVPGEVNESDFESPFCFYDLAADRDRIPELQVRAVYWPPNDPAFLRGSVSEPYELIRYSWDQENVQNWRYAVGLAGRHAMDSRVTFAGIEVLTVPYGDFPAWVTDRAWDMAVFAEFTGEGFWTSEGNYSVSYPEDLAFAEYFTGRSDVMPSPEYEPGGQSRMEWAMDHGDRPYLYFSPVDRRLHLLGAGGGAFALDGARSIRYGNLGGDHINHWTLWEGGEPVQSLFFAAGWLVHAAETTLQLTRVEVPPASFTTLPPRNHDEWARLGAELAAGEPSFAPDDFGAMARQFGPATGSISGAAARDFRLLPGGFRFVLSLEEGYRVAGKDPLSLAGRAPGEYVVAYDGEFHLQPLTPPAIRFSLAPPQAAAGVPTQYIEVLLPVTVHNEGLEDARTVRVTLGAEQPGQAVAWSEPQTVTVPAEGSTALRFVWVPDQPGEWQLQVWARVVDPPPPLEGQVVVEQAVVVRPAPQTDLRQELSAFGLVAPWQALLLMASLALAAGAAGWVVSRSMRAEAGSGPHDGGPREKDGL